MLMKMLMLLVIDSKDVKDTDAGKDSIRHTDWGDSGMEKLVDRESSQDDNLPHTMDFGEIEAHDVVNIDQPIELLLLLVPSSQYERDGGQEEESFD